MSEIHPEYKGSAEWLNEATVIAQRISRLYSDTEGKRKIDTVLKEDAGTEYALMLTGAVPGGKTGIQKWFEAEVESIATKSGPSELSTYYHRLAEILKRLEDYLNRI